jgi:Prenyltransferase and squalene oxidase repeat
MRAAAAVAVLALLAISAFWFSLCHERARTLPNAELVRACDYLWSQQDVDGGWHSENYGVLRSGQSLTAFVLWALLEVPRDVVARDPKAVDRAVAFLVGRVDADGALGLADGASDYPNYATGLAVRVLRRVGGHADLVAKMARYLLGQQFAGDLDWRPTDPAYGAWGMGGPPRRREGGPGHVDLSMTRVVLQGLADLDPLPSEALVRSRAFLVRCTNEDGGFFFSTVVLGANKGGGGGSAFGSYGTTTADGVLALLASGLAPDTARVQGAGAWLVAHHRLDRVPGIPEDIPTRWAHALRFYYFAVSAEVLARLEVAEAPAGRDWRRRMRDELAASQRADGSWINPAGQVKEDDPLVATALAVRALAAAR